MQPIHLFLLVFFRRVCFVNFVDFFFFFFDLLQTCGSNFKKIYAVANFKYYKVADLQLRTKAFKLAFADLRLQIKKIEIRWRSCRLRTENKNLRCPELLSRMKYKIKPYQSFESPGVKTIKIINRILQLNTSSSSKNRK